MNVKSKLTALKKRLDKAEASMGMNAPLVFDCATDTERDAIAEQYRDYNGMVITIRTEYV